MLPNRAENVCVGFPVHAGGGHLTLDNGRVVVYISNYIKVEMSRICLFGGAHDRHWCIDVSADRYRLRPPAGHVAAVQAARQRLSDRILDAAASQLADLATCPRAAHVSPGAGPDPCTRRHRPTARPRIEAHWRRRAIRDDQLPLEGSTHLARCLVNGEETRQAGEKHVADHTSRHWAHRLPPPKRLRHVGDGLTRSRQALLGGNTYSTRESPAMAPRSRGSGQRR